MPSTQTTLPLLRVLVTGGFYISSSTLKISGTALSWIESNLCLRSQRVILDGKQSRLGASIIRSSGRQHFRSYSVHMLCIADLPNHIETSCLSYADDVKKITVYIH